MRTMGKSINRELIKNILKGKTLVLLSDRTCNNCCLNTPNGWAWCFYSKKEPADNTCRKYVKE